MLPAMDQLGPNQTDHLPSTFIGADFDALSEKQVWHPSLTSIALPVKVTEITKESDSGYRRG
jgi:hypothetical protein